SQGNQQTLTVTDGSYEAASNSFPLSAEGAFQYCRARGYVGGVPTGDHVPGRVGVMCVGDGTHLFRSNYSTAWWTVPALINDFATYSAGVTWTQAGRMGQEVWSRNGLVGGVYQGDEDSHAPGDIASHDRTLLCF